jgi:hypothetical protein
VEGRGFSPAKNLTASDGLQPWALGSKVEARVPARSMWSAAARRRRLQPGLARACCTTPVSCNAEPSLNERYHNRHRADRRTRLQDLG